MSTADGWELTVPEDAAELLAELLRHGVRPGQRLHVVKATGSGEEAATQPGPAGTSPRSFDFAASFSAEPDLSERTDEYLRRDFGRE
ncbi:hypothetical protein [Blastococcus capsensis]|uniref:hypothetical protein n=1 Tax=Blastococcus capsensis TaxID=1564163 RepID=UPI002542060C|nr:hypothetical protein [Blastococcus capsensis]MDK3255180.1 hypothetical protein [Blastococcus capsensis]